MPTINYLKYLRIKAGYTQKELALKIERSPSTVKAYEKKKLRVPKRSALKFKEIFSLESTKNIIGYVKSIHVAQAEYHKLLPNLPNVKISEKPSRIFDQLGLLKRKISLKDVHCLVMRKNSSI